MSTTPTPYLWRLMNALKFQLNLNDRGFGMGGLGSEEQMHAPTLINKSFFNPGDHNKVHNSWADLELINVVHDFDWTLTPRHSRREVPYIRMSEQAVNFNTVRQQIQYMLSIDNLAMNVTEQIVDTLGKAGNAIKELVTEDDKTKQPPSGIAGVTGLTEQDIGQIEADVNVADHLKSYHGLYGLTPTGFEYVFPYFNETSKNLDNNFSSVENTNLGGGVKDLLMGVVGPEGMFGSLIDIAGFQGDSLGVYIERPQLYDSPEQGSTTSFSFDLFNTTSTDSIIRNWHLVFMLVYQNLASRVSKVALDPPVMYEVEVPGVFYSPFCYISSINIANRGATRTMEIPYYTDYTSDKKPNDLIAGQEGRSGWHKFRDIQRRVSNGSYPRYDDARSIHNRQPKSVAGGDSIRVDRRFAECTVPDAYRVEITLQSLIPESKNTYFHSILNTGTRATGIFSNVVAARPEASIENIDPSAVPEQPHGGQENVAPELGTIPGQQENPNDLPLRDPRRRR